MKALKPPADRKPQELTFFFFKFLFFSFYKFDVECFSRLTLRLTLSLSFIFKTQTADGRVLVDDRQLITGIIIV